MKLKELPATVVHCKTKEEYDRLMQIYEDAGWKWSNGHSAIGNTYHGKNVWDDEQANTCVQVRNNFKFGPLDKEKALGRTVLSLSEFLREQGIEAEEFKAGDWVEVIEEFKHCGMTFEIGQHYKVKKLEVSPHYVTVHVPVHLHPTGEDWHSAEKKKLRKCPPPEEKREEPAKGGYIIPKGIDHDSIPNLLAMLGTFKPRPISFPKFPMDVLSKIRRAALPKVERQYRDLGLKNEQGHLTDEGQKVFVELLFRKFGKELMDPEVKRIASTQADDSDE